VHTNQSIIKEWRNCRNWEPWKYW